MSRTVKVIIADDELLARQRLARLASAIPEVEVLAACESADEVLTALEAHQPDLLLLDIHMPGLTGMDLAALLPEPRPLIAFCTAHPEHAVQAFNVGAVDYLLKPVDAAGLQRAIDRARTRASELRSRASAPVQRLAIETRQGIRLLDPAEITHVVLEGELPTVVTAREKVLADASLQQLHDQLAPFGFERVHRRALLHLGRVVRLKPLPTGGYLAETISGEHLEISRQAARELRRRLGLRRAPGEDEP